MNILSRKRVVLLLFLSVLNLIIWLRVFGLSRAAPLKVTFFDIGQGSSVFVQPGPSHKILIDGGPGKKILEKLAEEMILEQKNIDLVILSHPEKDHAQGLIYVLDHYQVNHLVWTGVKGEGVLFQEWKNRLEQSSAQKRTASKGLKIYTAGPETTEPRTWIEVLSPLENLKEVKPENLNDSSLVVKIHSGRTSFLFPGDISTSQEEKLENTFCDILQTAHHGSKASTGLEFLNKTQPLAAVVQAGRDNMHGHPHQEVLDRLDQAGVTTLITAVDGDVIVLSDGENLVIK